MSPVTWISVALLGGIAAVARFLFDGYVSSRIGAGLPSGTFAVNISGAFVLGLLDGLALSGTAFVLAGTATIGTYTTFSTWMLETHRLREDAQFAPALVNVLASVGVGVGAAALGHLIGAAL